MRFTETLTQKDVINGDKIAEVSASPVKKISRGQVPFEILKKIPEEAARHYKFVPLGAEEGSLEVGMVDPSNIEANEALRFIASKINMPLKIFLISEEDFELLAEEYKGIGGEVSKALGELETALSDTKIDATSRGLLGLESKIVVEAPITKIVAVIIKHAISGNASDIHIEPTGDRIKVRFRVDGTLHTSIVLPNKVHDAVVSRIKILTNMKIDEKRKPQDGRFDARIENREIDFRVSTFPTFYGEKVVIRVLDKEKGVKNLEELGFSANHLKIVREMMDKPYGLILLTGPTGSGKTTSLYAILEELDRNENNVISLEDPIEYNIDGMSQSQVRPEIGYDFASGLRSILRQDPDIIMVGEIRDKETAGLAIHAALTGHLVLSTLHTNNAAGVVPRLVDMGVDPFLIAPTFLAAIGQRLVRKLCPDSKKEVPLEDSLKEMVVQEFNNMPAVAKVGMAVPDKTYEGVLSSLCPRGTKGRMGAFEVLYRTPELERVILTNPTEPEIMKAARKQNMVTMREDGLLKMINGTISFDEFVKL